MAQAAVLGEVVRAWVEQRWPGEHEAAGSAAVVAMAAYEDGATVREACDKARVFMGSWLDHPSHREIDRDGKLGLAS